MSVSKLGKKYRVVVSKTIEGKRRRWTKSDFSTKAAAKAWEADLLAKLNSGVEIDKTRVLFTEFYDDWLERHLESGIKQQTRLNHLATQKIVHEYFKNVKLENLTRRRYQKFLDEYAVNHHSSTVRQVSMRVAMPIKEAFSDGILSLDPTHGAKFKGAESKAGELKFLEESDLDKLLEYIQNEPITPAHFAIYTAALSGMRAGEILALTLKDINVADKTISVTKTKTNRPPYEYTTPKTRKSTRVIAMPDRYFIQFERFLKAYPKLEEHIFGEKTTQSVPSHSRQFFN